MRRPRGEHVPEGNTPPELRTRERRLATILETCGDALLAWDAEGWIREVNEAACVLTGLSHADLTGLRVGDLLAELPEAPPGATCHVHLELRTPPRSHQQTSRQRPVSATIGRVESDAEVVAYALLRDESAAVAAQREAAAHLMRIHLLERELRALLDNAPLVIYRLEPASGQLLYLNRHAEQLLRVPLDEALRIADFIRQIHGDDRAAFEEAFASACRGERPAPYEARLLRGTLDERPRPTGARDPREKTDGPGHDPGDAGELIAQGTIYPLLGEDGQVTAVEGIVMDISAEHQARTRLIQADRLSTLGTIAAGVAHEINNPAGFLTLALTQLARFWSDAREPGGESSGTSLLDPGELIGDMQSAVERISLIARDLRLFANPNRPAQSERTYVDVNRAIQGALTLTRAQLMGRARVVLDLGSVPVVLMNDARLAQVLVNLLINAADAVSTTGDGERVITVRTRSTSDSVEISVTNTGDAIPEELKSRIWLPFFTTKGTAGTGLGLAISREIVESSGGIIEVESPVEHSSAGASGTRFVIRLALGVPQRSSAAPASRVALKKRGLRVLVVDDEVLLARAVAKEVGKYHDVTVALDPRRALELLCTDRFDAVLCDLRMPGLSGEALYAELRSRGNEHTDVFIFTTGIGFGPDVDRLLADSGRPLLEKPFTTQQLLAAIERVTTLPDSCRAAPR